VWAALALADRTLLGHPLLVGVLVCDLMASLRSCEPARRQRVGPRRLRGLARRVRARSAIRLHRRLLPAESTIAAILPPAASADIGPTCGRWSVATAEARRRRPRELSLRATTDANGTGSGDSSGLSPSALIGRSVESAEIWLHDLAAELGTDDPRYAARVLGAVLHALRDRLTVAETAQLAAQLPTLVRGIYYERWKPGSPRHARHDLDCFLASIVAEAGLAGETEASLAVSAVARLLHRHVSEGELDDVLAVLPPRLRPLFELGAPRRRRRAPCGGSGPP
jgi:uncharacterized protein (DUF2267 family)